MAQDFRSLSGRISEISVNHPNHICVVADMSSSTWKTVGTHEVFTVTGLVLMRMWLFCTENLTGGSEMYIAAGDAGVSAYVTPTIISPTAVDVGFYPIINEQTANLWSPVFPSGAAGQDGGILEFVVYNQDIGYELLYSAVTDGTLEFHCIWEPLSVGASVVAGSGGSL